MPAHSGRIADKDFEKAINTYGMKMLDVGWLYMANCNDVEFTGNRLGDLGPRFHKAFGSLLSLFL